MYVILALLLLGVLVMAHEAGHYWAARASGIEVQEFAIGMGPQIAGWKNRRGTKFSVRMLPVGGYCQFYGEDEENADPRAFNNQPVLRRVATVVSGPVMNFAVAIVAIVIYLSAVGIYSVVPRVAEVEENASAAGLMVGDTLLMVNGEEVHGDTSAVLGAIAASGGEPVTLRVRRVDEEKDIAITPFYDKTYERFRAGFTFDQERVRISLFESLPFSVSYNIRCVQLIIETLKNLIFKGEGVNDVTGPVGTVYVIQEVTRQGGIDIYMELIALISVNLGVMNLLPVPGLDGSRLLFLIVEGIRRKPISSEIEGRIHAAGFVLLMGLMLALTYKDIMQIFLK